MVSEWITTSEANDVISDFKANESEWSLFSLPHSEIDYLYKAAARLGVMPGAMLHKWRACRGDLNAFREWVDANQIVENP